MHHSLNIESRSVAIALKLYQYIPLSSLSVSMLALMLTACGGGGSGGGGSQSTSTTLNNTATGSTLSLPVIEEVITTTEIQSDKDLNVSQTGNVTFQLLRSGDFSSNPAENKTITNALIKMTKGTTTDSIQTNEGRYTTQSGSDAISLSVTFDVNSIDYNTGITALNPLSLQLNKTNTGTYYVSELSTLEKEIEKLESISDFSKKFPDLALTPSDESISTLAPTKELLAVDMQISLAKKFTETWLLKYGLSESADNAREEATKAFNAFIAEYNGISFSTNPELQANNLLNKLDETIKNQMNQDTKNAFAKELSQLLSIIKIDDDIRDLTSGQQEEVNLLANNQDIIVKMLVTNMNSGAPEINKPYQAELWVADERTDSEISDSEGKLIGASMTLSSPEINFGQATINGSLLPITIKNTTSNDGTTLQLTATSIPTNGQGGYLGDGNGYEKFADFSFTLKSNNPTFSLTIDDSQIKTPSVSDQFNSVYFIDDWDGTL